MRLVGLIYLTHASPFTSKYGVYVCRTMSQSGDKELALAHHP
jgi:hypothetical protein